MTIAISNLVQLTYPSQMQPEWQRLASQRETCIRKL